MSNYAIQLEKVSKCYRIGLNRRLPQSLAGNLLSWVSSPVLNFRRLRSLSHFDPNTQSDDVIWAIKDLSFTVRHGEVVGIIGRNGAGKTTTLMAISRITRPTHGKIVLRGRVASLLEVGTGFHMELTGRENVYLNATILGMSKQEVDRKFDEIVHFSGVEKFIDTPFKHYSSGMKVRLGFAVAAHLEAEILLVDEVLAVGDLRFQQKCIGRMQEIASEGRTVLFISHDMAAVERLCSRSILLVDGRLTLDGATQDVIAHYVGLHGQPVLEWRRQEEAPDHPHVTRVTLIGHNRLPLHHVTSASDVGIEIECSVIKPDPNQKLAVIVRDSHENPIFISRPIDADVPYPNEKGLYTYRVFFPSAIFMPRRYVISVAYSSPPNWAEVLLRAITIDVLPGASIAMMEGKSRRGLIQIRCLWEMDSSSLETIHS